MGRGVCYKKMYKDMVVCAIDLLLDVRRDPRWGRGDCSLGCTRGIIQRETQRKNMHFAKKNDTFEFDDVKIKTLRVFNKQIVNSFVNNSSSVYRIESLHGSILILGDWWAVRSCWII